MSLDQMIFDTLYHIHLNLMKSKAHLIKNNSCINDNASTHYDLNYLNHSI